MSPSAITIFDICLGYIEDRCVHYPMDTKNLAPPNRKPIIVCEHIFSTGSTLVILFTPTPIIYWSDTMQIPKNGDPRNYDCYREPSGQNDLGAVDLARIEMEEWARKRDS